MKIIKDVEDYVTERVNMFGDCERVLDILKEERVFSVLYTEKEKEFWISEQCDRYFGVKATSEMCRDLSELFLKMAILIEENSNE